MIAADGTIERRLWASPREHVALEPLVDVADLGGALITWIRGVPYSRATGRLLTPSGRLTAVQTFGGTYAPLGAALGLEGDATVAWKAGTNGPLRISRRAPG
jgi:hypothetical protein